MMRKSSIPIAALVLCFSVFASAQIGLTPRTSVESHLFAAADQPRLDLPNNVPLPRMAPELALQLFMEHTAQQSQRLAEYTDETVIEAELPDTAQKGEYELVRNFSAQPRSLSYRSVKFTGDTFVKTNVITRFLQSEVDHVRKGDPSASAISETNYKFSYKGTDDLNGRMVHIFQIKPRRKDPSLFKGKIYVDAYTGTIRRAEGTVSKSPSFFIRKIEFVQDFEDIDGFTVPVSMRSTAKARIIGRTIVTVLHRAYSLRARPEPPATALLSNIGQ